MVEIPGENILYSDHLASYTNPVKRLYQMVKKKKGSLRSAEDRYKDDYKVRKQVIIDVISHDGGGETTHNRNRKRSLPGLKIHFC